MKRLAIFAGPLALAVTISAPAEASARDAGLCEQAAVRAARQTGVPRDVLLAIMGTPLAWLVIVAAAALFCLSFALLLIAQARRLERRLLSRIENL